MSEPNNSQAKQDQAAPQQEQAAVPHNLGLAGGMAKRFITSPLSLLLLLSFFALGFLGVVGTPKQEDPQISVPMFDIFVQYPGASSKQVESLLASPLESIMNEITGVEHVYSVSHHGMAMVTVQFEVGEDAEASSVKLHNKMEANKDIVPRGVSMPLIKERGVDDVPVVALTLWSNEVDDANLRMLGLDVLQQLRSVPNTSQSFIVDGREDQLTVEILPERLAAYNLSMDSVVNAIRAANSRRQAGYIEPEGRYLKVYTGSFLKSAEDIRRLKVADMGTTSVYIRDVAKVSSGPSEATKMVGYYTGKQLEEGQQRADGAPAVTLAIAKKKGTNGVNVSQAILKKVDDLKGHIIPDNVHVEVTRNYGKTANDKVNMLLGKLLKATGIVTILVWLFLGWRAGLVVLLVIPSVITTTVFAALILGLTIDRVSLFALIFSIGILVDDAIVVVENIYRRWLLEGQLKVTTAVDAVREVGNPTILATFTVIAALIPMGMVGGMMGPYMSPIPILGSVAMIISLFAAFAFTPWLTNQLKPSLENLNESAEKEHRQAAKIEKFFRALIIPMIKDAKKGYAFLFGIIVVFFLCLILFATKSVKVKMLPLDNKPEFNIVINFPEGTDLTTTANFTHDLASRMAQVEDVKDLQTYVGTASPFNFNGLVRHSYLRQYPWQADIQIQLREDRSRTSHEVAAEARENLTPLAEKAGARIQIVEMPPGPPVLQSVVGEIYGPDEETRRQLAEDLTKIFEQSDRLGDVDNLLEADHQVLRFKVDAEKAQRNGISVEDVNRALDIAMGGYVIGDIKANAYLDPTDIVIQVPLSVRSQINRLIQLPVTNRMGNSVALSELVSFAYVAEDKPIYHKDLKPVEFVTAETVGALAAPVYGQFHVEKLLADSGYRAPDNVVPETWWFSEPETTNVSHIVWGGEWTVTWETFHDMGIAFMGALVLIYIVIVAQFGNFLLPAIIMAPIPLTLIGILPGHWLMGADFTATSMIGFIALAGIIVRNSILLVDCSREYVLSGLPVTEAVVKACETRTRPIAITALALIGGSIVILDDPIFQGMAVALIFGGLVSTMLTLLVIPLGCVSASKALCSKADAESGEIVNVCNTNANGNDNSSGGGAGQALKASTTQTAEKKSPHIAIELLKFTGLYLLAFVMGLGRAVRGLYYALNKRARHKKQAREDAQQAAAKRKAAAIAAARKKREAAAQEAQEAQKEPEPQKDKPSDAPKTDTNIDKTDADNTPPSHRNESEHASSVAEDRLTESSNKQNDEVTVAESAVDHPTDRRDNVDFQPSVSGQKDDTDVNPSSSTANTSSSDESVDNTTVAESTATASEPTASADHEDQPPKNKTKNRRGIRLKKDL